MAIQHDAVLDGGVSVVDVYTRTKSVPVIKKDRVGSAGIYAVCECETFKDEATAEAADGQPLQLEGGNIHFKIVNLDTDAAYQGLTGDLVPDAFGVLYARAKQEVVDRGWEASVGDIDDV